jgi:hypothetical protein
MSKTAKWGHWVLAAMFAIDGIKGIWDAALELIGVVRAHQDFNHLFLMAAGDLFGITLCFLFAWGVMTWANWAHLLLVPWYALACVAVGIKLISDGLHFFGPRGFLHFMVGLAALIWLLQPSVRAEYWRKERVA